MLTQWVTVLGTDSRIRASQGALSTSGQGAILAASWRGPSRDDVQPLDSPVVVHPAKVSYCVVSVR